MTRLTNKTIRLAALFAITAAISLAARAQTANWINGAGDNDWNNALNWDIGVPAEGTNAVIGAGNTVNYTAPMVAGAFESLTDNSPLNINAGGFVVAASGNGAVTITTATGLLSVNSGGIFSATNGGVTVSASAGATVAAGGSLTASGLISLGASANVGFLTNNGGAISATGLRINPNNASASARCIILGGTNDLGNVSIWRSSSGSAAYPAIGTEGLVISNGLVRMTSLSVGNPAANSALSMVLAGGIVTNTGGFIVQEVTSGRGARFLQLGGLFVSTDSSGARVAITNAGQVNTYSVLGGTNIVERFVLGDITNNSGTVNFTNAAQVYVGSGGIVSNLIQNLNVSLNSGGTFGASADWVCAVPVILAGGAFDCADLGGSPHNITLANTLRGTAPLQKNGAGTLTLSAPNTYSGNTIINQGTLALTGAGSISSSPAVIIRTGTTLDVSGVSGGFALGASRTLGGSGVVTGIVATASGAIINPGSNFLTGTLSFSNSVTQTGGTINHFDLSTNPSGPDNDFVVIAGDLNASGANTMEISGGGGPGSVHPLIRYGNNFNGTVGNFGLIGAGGTLSNNASLKTIYLVVASAIRTPTNVVWVGNSSVNDWDTINRTNWLNAGALDFFVTGDNVLFDATGAANPIVNVVGNVAPASTTVGAAANYTFAGIGNITGTGSLTKTNSGTLTILTTNAYTGVTTIGGGTLAISSLALGGANSGIGAASTDPNNVVLDAGALRYLGGSVTTDRGMTINAGGGTIDVATNDTILTQSGLLNGSGALTKAGPGTLVLGAANGYSGGTVLNQGRLQVDANAAAGTGGLTNNNSALRVQGALVLDNIVDFEGNCALEFNGVGGNNVALRGAWFGGGTVNVYFITANASQTCTIGGAGSGGGHMWDFSGTVDFGTNSGFLRINNDNSTFNFGSSNATFNVGTGSGSLNQRNGGTTTHLGALLGGPGTKLAGRGNTGAAGATTYSIGAKNLSTVFAGSITNGGTGTTASPTAITKVGTARLTLTGISVHTGDTTVQEGTLEVDGAFDISPVALVASPVTVNGGALSGNGLIAGTVNVNSGGTLSPGASVGILTISNALSFQPGSTNLMELDKATGTNDAIVGLSSVSYGGTLIVTNLAGTLAPNDSFKLFDAAPGTYLGAFETIILPTVNPPSVWDTSGLTVDGTIKLLVPVVSRPAISSATIEGGAFILRGTNNGNTSAFYYVLTSTNIATPLSGWTPLATNQFEVDGSFVVTNGFNSSEPRRFYLLQTP